MATTKKYILHDDVTGGVDTTAPAHLIGPDKWRTQHNMRVDPELQQIPHKFVATNAGGLDVRWLGLIPTATPGYGKLITLLSDADAVYRRWATALYDGRLYYTNEITPLAMNDGLNITTVTNAPAGRYLTFWYDHAVIGYPAGQPNRLQISDLYDFTKWVPTATNESDYYDMVEWQQTDYPFTGMTGMGKLHGTLWVYTPTAIIPFTYVGLPKIMRLNEEGVITRNGNTFPWTVVALDTVHFYYDALESMFFVFDGATVQPVGEPVRQYMQDNLSTNILFASKMYGYVDTDHREIWWPFVSNVAANTTGTFDKAVVFNYRYRKWFTASVEDVQCFCSSGAVPVRTFTDIGSLAGAISALTGTIGQLGLGVNTLPRIYGSATGQILQDEVIATDVSTLIAADDPVLESGDFHYGDLRTVKENDSMIINAALNTGASIDIAVSGRNFLGDAPTYPTLPNASWTSTVQDSLSTYAPPSGRILRYRFTLKNARLASFAAFSDGVYAKAAEK